MTRREFVVIRTFINHIDADLAKMTLEVAGIESFVRSDDCGGMRPHLWMGGVELLVDAEDVGRSEEILGGDATNPNGSTIWAPPRDMPPE